MRGLIILLAVALCQAVPVVDRQKTQEQTKQFCQTLGESRGLKDITGPQGALDCLGFFTCLYGADNSLIYFGFQPCGPTTFWSNNLKTCVPAYMVEKECALSLCDKQPDLPECLETEEPEAPPKNPILICNQGEFEYQMIDDKRFKRTNRQDRTITSDYRCDEPEPYFDHERCTCVAKGELPLQPNNILPPSVPLEDDECFSYATGHIYKKDGVKHFSRSSNARENPEEMDCPADKLIFRLDTCKCDVITLEDRLTESHCLHDTHVYKMVSENQYTVANLDTPLKAGAPISCPPSVPIWNLEKCDCEADPNAVQQETAQSLCTNFDAHPIGQMVTLGDGKIWVDKRDVTVGEVYATDICFDGSATSRLSIPYYNYNSWGNTLTFGLRFKFDKYGHSEYSSIVHNGVSGDQTIDIAVQDFKVKASVVVNGVKCTVEQNNFKALPRIETEYLPAPEYDVIVVQFDGEKETQNLKLTLNHNNSKATYADCKGSVDVAPHPVVIGASFSGCIDNLNICKNVGNPFPIVQTPGIIR